MVNFDLPEEIALAEEQLKAIDIGRLQNSELKKDPRELEKSYSEIEFDFARKLVEKTYKKLIEKYKN